MPQTQSVTIGFGATEFQFMMRDGLVARSADSAKLGSLQFNPTYINITTPQSLFREHRSGLTILKQPEQESDLRVQRLDLTMGYGQTFFVLEVSDLQLMVTQGFSSL